MPRKNKNKKNKKNNNQHGCGRGPGRAGPNDVPTTVVPAATPAHRALRHPYPHTNADFDVVIQQWVGSPIVPGANRGANVNRGRKPWRGGTPKLRSGAGTPLRGADSSRRGDWTPRGMGAGRGRGRGRGRGGGWERDNGGDHFSAPRRPHFGGASVGAKTRTIIGRDAPLSDLLYSERPLLRPVKFVRATLTPFLFQHSEEVLKPALSQAADTTETSQVPTADRVTQLFHANAPDSDLESESHAQSALEEIDFADLAQVRAEVDAVAQGTAMMDQDASGDQEEIEEVDFADLAAMRAKVDTAQPQTASRDRIIQEAFTGVYNQIKDALQVLSTTEIVDDDQPYGVQQTASLSAPPTLDGSLDPKPPSEISNLSNHESFPRTRDTIVVEEEVLRSSNASPNVSVEGPFISTVPETHHALVPTGNIPLHPDAPHDDPHPLFVIDTASALPFSGRSASDVILVDRTGYGEMLGDQDEERIVYVAPHPRSGRASPVPVIPRVKLPQTSMLTGRSLEAASGLRSPVREDDAGPMPASGRDHTTHAGIEGETGEDHHLTLASLTLGPTTSASTSTHLPCTNAVLRARKKEVRRQRQDKRGQMAFGAFGAMVSEARLREEDVRERRRPRWETRRKEDSDVDWGTEDEDEGKEGEGEEQEDEDEDEMNAASNGLGGMEIDPDLELDIDAMQGFLKSMSVVGSQFVTMDDIEDEARMRREEEEGDGGPEGSSDSGRSGEEEVDEDEENEEEEEEEAFNIEEEIFIAESEGDDELELSEDSDDDEEEEELSPRSSFQARLRQVRERCRSQHPETTQETPDDENGEDTHPPLMHNVEDEDFMARISDYLEKNSQILSDHDREEKAVSRDLYQGHVNEWSIEARLDDPEFTTPVNKKKGKKGKCKQATGHFSLELQAQWAKDRAKKAEHKRQRRTARLVAEFHHLDPSAMLYVAPGAIVDMDSLEAQLRRFVEDVGWKGMVLPPMDKEMRVEVHEMARVFGVKSVSQGDEDERYTSLFKTDRTRVKEGQLKALKKRRGGKGGGGGELRRGKGKGAGEEGGRRAKGGQMPKHREGDEVGKEAPKIGESNVGFRMLASMGWSKGNRIGGTASVGIDVPLTAIIKNSKLGLGATR